MKRFVKRFAVVAFLAFATPAIAADWTSVAPQVRDSIVEIQVGDEGACTGFVIDNDRDLVLTAAHCDPGPDQQLFADLRPASVKAKDDKNDLLVLEVKGIDRPALRLAKDDPKIGEEVASYGYGYALENPMFRVAHVSVEDISINRSRYIMLDIDFVPGQSGGPVVNAAGDVVMIVQMGDGHAVGIGIGAERIDDRVGRFFSKK